MPMFMLECVAGRVSVGPCPSRETEVACVEEGRAGWEEKKEDCVALAVDVPFVRSVWLGCCCCEEASTGIDVWLVGCCGCCCCCDKNDDEEARSTAG